MEFQQVLLNWQVERVLRKGRRDALKHVINTLCEGVLCAPYFVVLLTDGFVFLEYQLQHSSLLANTSASVFTLKSNSFPIA